MSPLRKLQLCWSSAGSCSADFAVMADCVALGIGITI